MVAATEASRAPDPLNVTLAISLLALMPARLRNRQRSRHLRHPVFAGHHRHRRVYFHTPLPTASSVQPFPNRWFVTYHLLNGNHHTLGGLAQGRVIKVNVAVGGGSAPMSEQAPRDMQAFAVHYRGRVAIADDAGARVPGCFGPMAPRDGAVEHIAQDVVTSIHRNRTTC